MKAKRVRDVLKAHESVLSFATKHAPQEEEFWTFTEKEIASKLNLFKEHCESDGVKKTCGNIVTMIEKGVVVHKQKMEEEEKKKSDMTCVSTPKSKSKSKSKKKAKAVRKSTGKSTRKSDRS